MSANREDRAMRRHSFSDSFSDDSEDLIPEAVISFLQDLNKCIPKGDIEGVRHQYEVVFDKLTDRYYKNIAWPGIEAVEKYIDSDVSLTLYKEIYYRHIYARLSPTFEDRLQSWLNYCSFFDYLLFVEFENHKDRDFSMALPKQWIWDILDEFVYQYSTYHSSVAKVIRASTKDRSMEDRDQNNSNLKEIWENHDIWDSRRILCYLQDIVDKSNIVSYIKTKNSKHDHKPDTDRLDAFNSEFARSLGLFAMIELARMQALLGDYNSVISIELDLGLHMEQHSSVDVLAAHVSLYYYTGFARMMLRDYPAAIKLFSTILLFLSRVRTLGPTPYQIEQTAKKQEQILLLLLLCSNLFPAMPLEEVLRERLKEHHSDKQARFQKGDIAIYEELFTKSCPKFVSPVPMDKKNSNILTSAEAFSRQVRLFTSDVKSTSRLATIRSYLKLYSSITLDKLALLMETDQESLVQQLMALKMRTMKLEQCDLDFTIDQDLVTVSVHHSEPDYAEVFLDMITKFSDLMD